MQPNRSFSQALLLVVVLAFTPIAQSGPLGEETISRFLASLEQMQSLGQNYSASEWGDGPGFGAASKSAEMNLMADAVAAMKGHEIYGEMERITREHGFDSPEQWSVVGDRILKAYSAAMLEAEQPGARDRMSEAMQELENAQNLSPQQKEMMMQAMGNAVARVRSLTDAPPADIQAIRPHMAEIKRMFSANSGWNSSD